MPKAVAVVVFAVFVVAACSGSDEVASTDSTVTEQTTTVTESVATTEVATTSTVETTIAPTTTVDDDEARLRAAEQAYIAAWEATWAAFRDPANSGLRAEAESLYVNANRAQLSENIQNLIEDGYAAVESPSLEASATIVGPARFIDDEQTLVDLVVCEVNTDWFVEVGAAPDGSNALVRDEPVSVLIVARLEFVDDIWKPRGGDILSEVVEADTCDV